MVFSIPYIFADEGVLDLEVYVVSLESQLLLNVLAEMLLLLSSVIIVYTVSSAVKIKSMLLIVSGQFFDI